MLDAVRPITARYGIEIRSPAVLHDSNHTVIHLAPAPLVVKAITSPFSTANPEREVRVARFLADHGAPVVPPSSLLPPGPHTRDGIRFTFWEYCPHTGEEPSSHVLAAALRQLHDALAQYPDPLPAWGDFTSLETLLADPAALTALDVADRRFLHDTYHALRREIAVVPAPVRPIHGEPHSRNLLLSPAGPRWIDFEAVCSGPQEWDLTVLPDEELSPHFEDVDRTLLDLMRQMRSLVVAAWCWADPDRAPILREAGTFHLTALKDTRA